MVDVSGKVALVTGAGVRIGRALALALGRRGAHVVVHHNRSSDAATEVVAEIEAMGGHAKPLCADLRDADNAARVVEQSIELFGKLDILINSAAIFRPGTLQATTLVDWDEHFAINLRAPFFLCQAFARHLAPDQRGHIINLADWRAIRPGIKYVAYTLTKTALVAMTKSLALALGPNTQVNAIAPGAILPPPGGDAYFRTIAERIPAGKHGSPSDITKAVLYLLDADFVTGEVLFVTGGEHL